MRRILGRGLRFLPLGAMALSLVRTLPAFAQFAGSPCANNRCSGDCVCNMVTNMCMMGASNDPRCGARSIFVDIGTRFNLVQLFARVAGFMATTISILCVTLFIIGAFYWTASRGNETWVQRGRDFMIGSLLGLVTVLGSYALLRLILYVLYCQAPITGGAPPFCIF